MGWGWAGEGWVAAAPAGPGSVGAADCKQASPSRAKQCNILIGGLKKGLSLTSSHAITAPSASWQPALEAWQRPSFCSPYLGGRGEGGGSGGGGCGEGGLGDGGGGDGGSGGGGLGGAGASGGGGGE